MKLLHDHPTVTARNPKESDLEVKERRSSNASLLLMNPVASGDNVTTGLNSAHRLKEELPPLVPCCEGKELQINEDLVCSGLSAISVKHESVMHCLSMSEACNRIQLMPGIVKRRNSYRCLHRPDLKRVPYLGRMTPDELESVFRGHADFPALAQKNDNEECSKQVMLAPDENSLNRDLRTKEGMAADENGVILHPIPEVRSGADDVPSGMRLHGARARLYTSVQAVKAGDQRDCDSAFGVLDSPIAEDLTEEELQLREELQIILPPRPDDVVAESTATSEITNTRKS